MRRSLINTGGSLMAISIGLFASGWPSIIATHAWLVSVSAISGCGLVIAGFIFPAKHKTDDLVQSLGSGNVVGRDNSGKMINHVQHYHEASDQAPLQIAPTRAPMRHRERANLVGLDPKNMRLDDGFLKANWLPVAVFPIENRIGRTMTARDICASIRFNGSTEDYVKRAYWSGKQGNVNEIPIGDIQSVVVGQKIDNHWYYFDNPRAYPETWGSVSYAKLPDPRRLELPNRGITAEVKLFNPDDGKVLLAATLLIGSDGTITRAR